MELSTPFAGSFPVAHGILQYPLVRKGREHGLFVYDLY